MAGKGSTAEHQLLKAIEKGSSGNSRGSRGDQASGERKIFLEKLFEGIDSIVGRLAKVDYKELFDVPRVKKMLFVLVAVLVAAYGIMMLRGVIKLQSIPKFEVSALKEVTDIARIQLPVRSHEYYIDRLVARNIFKAGAIRVPEEEVAPREPRIQEKAKDLKLVGISWASDADERYAMIEDMNTQLTYHVRENERFLDFTVKSIEQEFVTIGSGKEEMDLR